MKTVVDLTGRTFGRWTVLERSPRKHRRVLWICRCTCDSIREIPSQNLVGGLSRSCGCLRAEVSRARCSNPETHIALKHGHARNVSSVVSPEYNAWNHAKHRCSKRTAPEYRDYGARGITMCSAWRTSFEVFLRDMGPRPGAGYSLDRIDNDGPYAPGNCRWATAKEQANNRRPKGHAKTAQTGIAQADASGAAGADGVAESQ